MSFSSDFITWLGKPARRCLIAEVGVKTGGSETTRYLSNVGFVSASTDTPANQLYTGIIAGVGEFSRRLSLDGTGGSISYGEIELDNTSGNLDSWLGDVWSGRAINIYFGEQDWAKSQFALIFTGTVDDIAPKSRNKLSLKLRDIFGPINTTLSTATIGGTGDNKDVLRPIGLGECFNVTPVLIDAATQKYAPHLNAAMERTIEVRDSGLSVGYTATTASGYFTLTAARYGEITCDIQGAKIAGSYRNDVGGLIEWVATLLGDGNFLTSGQIDATALTTFRAANTQPVGLYLPDRANRLQVMQQLAASIGATVTTSYDGKLILVKVGFGTPVGSIGTKQMVDGTFQPIGRPEVRGAIRLDGERNWTPQPSSSITGSVTAAQWPIFENEYVTLAASDGTVLSDWYLSSTPAASETLMVVEADITAEASRLLTLWKTARKLFAFDGFAECLQYEIGDTITLTHPRFGLSGGASAQIVGVLPDWMKSRVRLEVLV